MLFHQKDRRIHDGNSNCQPAQIASAEEQREVWRLDSDWHLGGKRGAQIDLEHHLEMA